MDLLKQKAGERMCARSETNENLRNVGNSYKTRTKSWIAFKEKGRENTEAVGKAGKAFRHFSLPLLLIERKRKRKKGGINALQYAHSTPRKITL